MLVGDVIWGLGVERYHACVDGVAENAVVVTTDVDAYDIWGAKVPTDVGKSGMSCTGVSFPYSLLCVGARACREIEALKVYVICGIKLGSIASFRSGADLLRV